MNYTAKNTKESAMETRYLIMPNHTNHQGTAFGGTIMSWIDMIAAMVAQKHCGREVVTVCVERITFESPVNIGDHLILKSSMNYVGNTSMEVGVSVIKENPFTGECVKTTSAYLTFVALDENKKPAKVPQLIIETEEEQRRFDNAKIRAESRKELLKKLKKKE